MSLYTAYCDGACRGQGAPQPDGTFSRTGEGAIGIQIFRNKKQIGEYARALGTTTNNLAEYEAVLHTLLICFAADLSDAIIYSDSSLVVNQVNGVWQCDRQKPLWPLLSSIIEIRKEFRFRLVQVPRSQVSGAHALAGLMLEKLNAERAE